MHNFVCTRQQTRVDQDNHYPYELDTTQAVEVLGHLRLFLRGTAVNSRSVYELYCYYSWRRRRHFEGKRGRCVAYGN